MLEPNDHVRKLAAFVAAYIASDVKIHNAIRTPFDEMDAQMRGDQFLRPRSKKGHWFNKKNFRNDKIVELALSGHFPYVSLDATKFLTSFRDRGFKGDIEVICEHVVPCSVMENMLREQHKRKSLDADAVLEFHRRFYRRAVITRAEDKILNTAKLRKRMPDQWSFEHGNPFDRYTMAGFDWARTLT